MKRVWKLAFDFSELVKEHGTVPALTELTLNASQKTLRRELHKTIAKVSDDIGRRNTFNTAIASIMELMNHLSKAQLESAEDRAVMQEAVRAVIIMLTPITPHMCHEIWKTLGDANSNNASIEEASWPIVDESALVEDEKLIIVQVNGKVRAKITVSATASKEEVEALGLSDETVARFTDEKTVRKVIYIPGKLLNIVAN